MKSLLEVPIVTEKVQEFLTLLQFPEVQVVLKDIILSSLHESNVFINIKLIKEHLGEDESNCIGRDLDFEKFPEFKDEREPLKRLSLQLKDIEDKINSGNTTRDSKIIAGNVTEIRARLLFDKIPSMNYRQGKRFMLTPEVKDFLLTGVPDEYKTTITGAKKAAKDVMMKSAEMFPNELKIGKTSRNTRFIEFKEENNC